MTEVWYAAYGSNTLAARFRHYLEGGAFLDGQVAHPGCRDATPPADSTWREVPGEMVFAGAAARWGGGGVSFLRLDDSTARSLVRLWLVTTEQLLDVQAQECGRRPGDVDVDLPDPGTSLRVVDARYGTLSHLGTHAGRPITTFTGEPPEPFPSTPHPDYLGTVARGLIEAGADRAQVIDYLLGRPGVAGALNRADVASVADVA